MANCTGLEFYYSFSILHHKSKNYYKVLKIVYKEINDLRMKLLADESTILVTGKKKIH